MMRTRIRNCNRELISSVIFFQITFSVNYLLGEVEYEIKGEGSRRHSHLVDVIIEEPYIDYIIDTL